MHASYGKRISLLLKRLEICKTWKFGRHCREGRREEELNFNGSEAVSRVTFLLKGKRNKTWFAKQQGLHFHRGLIVVRQTAMKETSFSTFNFPCPFTLSVAGQISSHKASLKVQAY